MRFSSAHRARGEAKPPLTSMVDIVFLLLVFFVMTFHVVPAEGDFDIKYASSGEGERFGAPVVKVTVQPDPWGTELPSILWQVGFKEAILVDDMRTLNKLAWDWRKQHENVDGRLTEKLSVRLDVDPQLPFQTTIDALAALTIREHESRRVDLFSEVSFSPRSRKKTTD